MKRGSTNWRSMDRGVSRDPMDRVGTARGPMDRHELARGTIDRDGFGRDPRDGVGWGSLDRDRIGRDLLDRDRIGRDLLDRDRIGRDLLDRDRIGRDLLDRDRIGQDLFHRGRIDRDLLERDRIGRELLERDRIGHGAIGLDRISRDAVDRDRIGHDSRDGTGRFLLDRDRMGHGSLDRDGMSLGHTDRDAIKWGPLDRENMGRVSIGMGELHSPMDRKEMALDRLAGRALNPIDRSQLPWSSMDRGRMAHSPVGRERSPVGRERSPVGRERSPVGRERSPVGRERSPVGRERSPIIRDEKTWGRMGEVIMGREGIVPGFMDRGELVQGPMSRDEISRGLLARGTMTGGSMGREGIDQGPIQRDNFARGPVDRDGMGKSLGDQGVIAKGPVDPDNNQDVTLGSMDQDEKTQSDMEPCDMEQSDMEMSDTDQSEVNQGEVQDETQDKVNNVNQGQANDVTGADRDQENAKKNDNPEDDKNKFYCEICRLTCLSSMSYQSHMRGAKHLKNTTTLQVSGFRGAHKYRKIKKTGKSLKDYMDEPLREPLIGLEHVAEYSVPGKAEPSYHCELCGFKTELAPMIEHLNGFRHRRAYISKEFPFLLKAPPGQKEDKVQFLRRMAADIERDEGLKMYRADLLSVKKKIKSLLEIKPDEIPIQRNTSDNPVSDNETLKTKALQSLETYEIESDAEAVLLMTITQELSEILKAYCLKVKEETAHAGKVARARSVAETLSQANPAIPPLSQTFGPSGSGNWNLVPGQQAPHIAGNRNWPNNPVQQNQPAQYPAGGPNWNQGIMQNQPALEPGNWDRGSVMQVRQAQPASFGRPDMFGPKGIGSELSQFAPKESFGPGSFSSGSSGFGNEYGLIDRPPLLSSMPGAPPQLFIQKNPSAPAMNKLLDVPRSDPVANRFMRSLPDQGTMNQPVAPGGFRSNVPANFNTGPKMLPANINTDGRIGNVGYSQFMPPNSHLNADRAPPGPVLPMASEKPEKKASPLTAEILNRIRGKDVNSAKAILSSLLASNPALQKVNMANLLNLLVETGTISG